MTTLQFRRWQTFALRMAHRGFPDYRKPNRKRIAGYIKEFFRQQFPKCWRGDHTKYCSAGLVARIVDWDCTRERPGAYHHELNMGVGDMVSEYEDALPHLKRRLPERIEDADSSSNTWDAYEFRRNEVWGSRIRCCLRAGLDIASSPSAGVSGFTVGDLRRMYRGNVPAWVTDGFQDEQGKVVEFAAVGDDTGVWL